MNCTVSWTEKTVMGVARLWFALLMLSGGVALFGGACRFADVEVMPQEVLRSFSMTWWERPWGYRLIGDTNVLREAGIRRNPDYVTRRADVEATLKLGGLSSVLALYGPHDEPRLVIHGVYFKDRDKFENYVQIQRTRRRPVRAFEKETRDGWWHVSFARDADLIYKERELRSLHRGIHRYQRRLNMDEIFDEFHRGRPPPNES